MFVFGAGDTSQQAIEDHDRKLTALLMRCREKGIRLNGNKCQFRSDSISFLGHRITSNGLEPDSEKLDAILHMKSPKSVEEVQRLQGMVNYLARFMPRLSRGDGTHLATYKEGDRMEVDRHTRKSNARH